MIKRLGLSAIVLASLVAGALVIQSNSTQPKITDPLSSFPLSEALLVSYDGQVIEVPIYILGHNYFAATIAKPQLYRSQAYKYKEELRLWLYDHFMEIVTEDQLTLSDGRTIHRFHTHREE